MSRVKQQYADEIRRMLDEDKEYQEWADEYSQESWAAFDAEMEQQFEEIMNGEHDRNG